MKNQESIELLMRVLLCKIHCPPFNCFANPSSTLIYTQKQNSPPAQTLGAINGVEEEEEKSIDGKQQPHQELKSSLKNCCFLDSHKKKVQWMDFLGKQLVYIREFESSEMDDTESEDEMYRGCSCVIL
ncbi:uncharacterized protein LOC126669489 [Mercurialis annua]|uniref:uncharacterized protein LOC126669489 n=1 Tax=Mercurialis annua TaxID=3986 RepID=UPI00215E6509|nr:uncharacterized protein LOC126669489 [Mercurialis annua]